MFILKGKGIKKGTMVNGTHIIDLAPTILYASGLPVPEDMDGSLIADAFEKKLDLSKEDILPISKAII